MNLWESIISSWNTLKANKMRSGLTVLGIVIGVSAVVFLVSFGKGHQENITKIFEEMGANAIYITGTNMGQGITGGTGSLTLEDAEALLDPNRAPSVEAVAPMIEKMDRASYGTEDTLTDIVGITPYILEMTSYPIEKGRFIEDVDVRKRTSVAVLGYQTKQDLFGSNEAIGESIRVAGRKFEIVGVLEKKGGMMGTADDYVMIPLTTMQTKITTQTSARGRPVQTIAVKAVNPDEIGAATEQIKAILRQRHHIREGEDDDFTVVDMQEILNSMEQALGIFSVFLGSVGAISLVVGGIGIMNIMLVSVTERTREIGIRKAVGAKRRDILRQFLVEAAMLSLAGGVIGLLIAVIGTRLVSGLDLGGYEVSAPISSDIVIIAIIVAVGIGLISGSYPAFRAAQLDPIESLRHE
ncbi:MAG: ABC transporter permease [Dehalococcoidia bacterium]